MCSRKRRPDRAGTDPETVKASRSTQIWVRLGDRIESSDGAGVLCRLTHRALRLRQFAMVVQRLPRVHNVVENWPENLLGFRIERGRLVHAEFPITDPDILHVSYGEEEGTGKNA